MASSADLTRYLVWGAVVALGAGVALIDWRGIKRPLFGLLLIGGVVATYVSPFDFATGGYYIIGVIISAGSALALVGYACATVAEFAWRRLVRRAPSEP
jgi:hypothetical protein